MKIEFGTRERIVAAALVAAAGTAACGGSSTKAGAAAEKPTAAASPDASEAGTVASKPLTAPSPINTWFRPPSVKERPVMTEEECYRNWWNDVDGQRQQEGPKGPPQLTIDGRCNEPLDENFVGLYDRPEQTGNKAVKIAHNGDKFDYDCYVEGESIRDVRGASSASVVWVGLKGSGLLVPEVNVGYIDEKGLELREC